MDQTTTNHIQELKPDIFDFENFRDFLSAAAFPQGRYNHQSQTLYKLAKSLGYKSASSLTMVFNGQRLPSREMMESFSIYLGLGPKEREYFYLLVELERRQKKNKDTSMVLEKLDYLNDKKQGHSMDLKTFRSMSDWYFTAIKQLIEMKDFVEDEEWIRKRLRKKVTPGQIRYALQTMSELGITERDDQGVLRVKAKAWRSTNDIPSSAIRKHHAGMLELAVEALEEQSIHERQISGLTLKVKSERLDEAKKHLYQMMKDFNSKFFDEDGEEVVQLNVQLFQLTKSLREKEKNYEKNYLH